MLLTPLAARRLLFVKDSQATSSVSNIVRWNDCLATRSITDRQAITCAQVRGSIAHLRKAFFFSFSSLFCALLRISWYRDLLLWVPWNACLLVKPAPRSETTMSYEVGHDYFQNNIGFNTTWYSSHHNVYMFTNYISNVECMTGFSIIA